MIAFLTSSPGGCCEEDNIVKHAPFSNANGFLDRLTSVWKEPARCLLICAEPDNAAKNDNMSRLLLESFALSGLSIGSWELCDSRNETELPRLMAASNVVILSGGHTLIQNHFFNRIELKTLIQNFDGILIGISGGSMNCAKVVYAQPEWDGDTTLPGYERFPEGLGLTDIMILPHYQVLKEQTLDGLRLIEDIALPDSMGRTIHAFPDGTYVLIQGGHSEIFGEDYVISDGTIRQL